MAFMHDLTAYTADVSKGLMLVPAVVIYLTCVLKELAALQLELDWGGGDATAKKISIHAQSVI
jgi:hypothetical protein